MRTPGSVAAGTCLCALGSYGGGLVSGDNLAVRADVGPQSTLVLTTQSSQKVYRSMEGRTSSSSLRVRVGEGGLLVVAPDPVVPFAHAVYDQLVEASVAPGASALIVDGLAGGRVANGERWRATSVRSRVALTIGPLVGDGEALPTPDVTEAIALDGPRSASGSEAFGFDLGDAQFNCVATVIATGPCTEAVGRQLLAAGKEGTLRSPGLRGRALLSAHEVSARARGRGPGGQRIVVARIAGVEMEDVYRVLHSFIAPLGRRLGAIPYQDRVHSNATGKALPRPPGREPQLAASCESALPSPPLAALSSDQLWAAQMLADSHLPTGGFAHSCGLEAVAQLVLAPGKEAGGASSPAATAAASVETTLAAITRSCARLQVPFATAAHAISGDADDSSVTLAWLDAELTSTLSSNAPALRASTAQGAALARVASHWLSPEDMEGLAEATATGSPHGAVVLGFVARRSGLPLAALHSILTYAAARDVLAAAIRLSLVGPLKGAAVLHRLRHAAAEGLCAAGGEGLAPPEGDLCVRRLITSAGSSAPVVDVIQGCHDSLHSRLFRS